MTPAPNVKIKLNELNKILDEMKMGEDAVKRMAELDSQRGIQDPAEVARRMRGDASSKPVAASSNEALGDSTLANNLRSQAERMSREAQGLLAEAQRLLTEAAAIDPVAAPTASVTVPAKKSRGRPKKTPVVA